MVKRILCVALCLLLLGSLCVFAEPTETAEATPMEPAPAESAPAEAAPPEMSAGGRGGRPGGMGGMPMRENGQGGMTPPQMPEGAGGMEPLRMQGETGSTEEAQNIQTPQKDAADSAAQQQTETGEVPQRMPGGGRIWGGNMGGMPGDMQMQENTAAEKNGKVADFLREYQTPLISLVLLVVAFFFVIFYKRKRY